MDGVFTMVVLIVLISVGAGVINNYLKLRTKQAKNSGSDAEFHKMKADIDRLTERVRVLEKIATDGDAHLRDEISRLA